MFNRVTKAVIIAGGKGTRLGALAKNKPKALLKIGGKPIIEHQLKFLKENGIKEVWLLLGYLGEQIKEYVQGRGKWGLNIYYHQEKKPLGTAGALKTLESKIKEDLLVLSGDVMLDFDVTRFVNWHKNKRGIASIVVHPSDHAFDSDLVETGDDGQIVALLKRPHPKGMIFRNLSIASVYIFSPRIFGYIRKNRKSDIEKDILPQILKSKKKMYAYPTPEYIKDMGTAERLFKVRRDYGSGHIQMNLKKRRRAIFLDRDGVINEEIDRLVRPEDLKVYDFAAEAVKKVNKAGFMAIIVSNQPMVAKGFIMKEDVERIHKKLETELAMAGAKIDAIYYCPHHPERGFLGEKSELKIECSCRKPEPGLLLKAKRDFNIDIKKSYLIGDKTSDILAGKRAGCRTILVKTGYGGKDKLFSVEPDFSADNLLTAVNNIICNHKIIWKSEI